jgi:dTDP-4-dehydrorhamnose reductase
VNVLVTGGRGQLGRALVDRARASGIHVRAVGRDALDICDTASVSRALEDPYDVVINAAAYTAVDRAETERERAFAVNRDGAGLVARACAERGIRMLHVSTDYVFDGTSTRPYREDDLRAPLSVYGESKQAGEDAVNAAGGVVVRTSWLFGEDGPGFVPAIVRAARERPVLHVVGDHGCPTYTGDLADALFALARVRALESTYHVCGGPPTTRHAFARAIVDEARRHVPVACERVELVASASMAPSASASPAANVGALTAARRPAYSVLDTSKTRALGIELPIWSIGLARVIAHALEDRAHHDGGIRTSIAAR